LRGNRQPRDTKQRGAMKKYSEIKNWGGAFGKGEKQRNAGKGGSLPPAKKH